MQNRLAVAIGPKAMAGSFKTTPEGPKIIDFTVENHANGAVLVRHWLPRAGQVDDAETAKPERHTDRFAVCVPVLRVDPGLGIVWTPVGQQLRHLGERRRIDRRRGLPPHRARYPAHNVCSAMLPNLF